MPRKRQTLRALEVIRKWHVSPNMLRITLGGEALVDFPEDQNGAYIKLRFTEPDHPSEEKPVIRTYTVRYFNARRRELDVDFVLHDVEGPAAIWAKTCERGDTIQIMGPGPKKLVAPDADWFIIVGDMSALPAIGANIESFSESARGFALLEVIDFADRQPFDVPEGFDIKWIINPEPARPNTLLLDAVKSIRWLDGTPSVWVAGEFSQSLAIRKYLKEKRLIVREQMYASSYWQIGKTEDGHRVSKAQVKE